MRKYKKMMPIEEYIHGKWSPEDYWDIQQVMNLVIHQSLKSAIPRKKDRVCDRFSKRKKNEIYVFIDLSVQLDLLVVVERSTTMANVRRQLEEQLAQQLDLLENNQINVSYS